jgi:hypothetical protein
MGCSSSSTAEGEEGKLFKDAEILRKKREEDVRGFLKSALLKNGLLREKFPPLYLTECSRLRLLDPKLQRISMPNWIYSKFPIRVGCRKNLKPFS